MNNIEEMQIKLEEANNTIKLLEEENCKLKKELSNIKDSLEDLKYTFKEI